MKKLLCVFLAAAFLLVLPPAAHAAAPLTKSTYYARSTLAGEELSYYDALYAAMPKRTAVEPDKFGITAERSHQLLQYMYNDAPEILGYYIVLGMQQEDAVNALAARKTQAAMGRLNANMDEAQKARALYEYLAQTITLETQDASEDAASAEKDTDLGNLVGGLINCKADSLGVARTYQYLLHQTGIPAYTVTGTALGQPHAWVLLQVDGEWYFADPALDMQTMQKGGQPSRFLLDHSIFTDHTVNQNENPPLPPARSTKYVAQVSAAVSSSAQPSAASQFPEEQVSPSVPAAGGPSVSPAPSRAQQTDANADNILTSVLVAIMIALVAAVILLTAKKRRNTGSGPRH